MGLPPTGKIVARPMLVRACGCTQEFQVYETDRYRQQRQAKFQSTRCPACAAKVAAEQNRKGGAPAKPDVLKLLPAGAQVMLTVDANGNWSGKLTAEGKTVALPTQPGFGPQAVIAALARLHLGIGG
jgi:hypothetical protein